MPDIALMGLLGSHGADGLLNGSPAITDGGLPSDALLLQLPQHQGPALPVHCHRTGASPHCATVDIDHIEIRLAMLAAIQFVQSQCPQVVGACRS